MRYDAIIESMVWSYSRITAFEQCPYRWLMQYILGVDKREKFFSQYGKYVHDVLQRHFSGNLPAAELQSAYVTGFQSAVWAPPPSEKTYKKYFTEGRQYFKVKPLPGREIIAVEDRLNFQYAGRTFVGFMDLLSRDAEGKICLTDHKSHMLKPRSNRKKPTASDKELDQYLRQLYMYASAVQQKYGFLPDVLEFNCFRNGNLIREPFDQKKFEETEAWAKNLIEEIMDTEKWLPNMDYWFCQHLCDVAAECEYLE